MAKAQEAESQEGEEAQEQEDASYYTCTGNELIASRIQKAGLAKGRMIHVTGKLTLREYKNRDQETRMSADVEYVYDGLMQLGAELCIDTVDLVLSTGGDVPSQPQQESEAHHVAPKIFKETCAIDFSLSAKRIYEI